MQIEYEATFPDIDKDAVRAKLEEAGAELKRPEFVQKRRVFNLPGERHNPSSWLRVRDEGDKVTMSLKIVDGEGIKDQKETYLQINDFEAACELLRALGCQEKAYQVTKRELWVLDGVEITIDEWPYLEPFVEVEGKSEEAVKAVSEKIGFDYSQALFCAVGTLYAKKYGISEERINQNTPIIDFASSNPFIE